MTTSTYSDSEMTILKPRTTSGPPDRASDVLRATRNPLDAIFKPRSVAVVGATEKAGSVGRTVLWNLISSPFGGTVLPDQPQALQHPRREGLPQPRRRGEPVDLAVIVTPPPSDPGVIDECVAAGVKGAIIISAGFREIGPEGEELERQVLRGAPRQAFASSAPTAWAS